MGTCSLVAARQADRIPKDFALTNDKAMAEFAKTVVKDGANAEIRIRFENPRNLPGLRARRSGFRRLVEGEARERRGHLQGDQVYLTQIGYGLG
jgi:hypothetical protein